MSLDPLDRRLLAALEAGLPLVPRPYGVLAESIGTDEADVLARLGRLTEEGPVKRFGVVVRHHALGWTANAMVVWDIEDVEIAEIGPAMAAFPFVTLCYRRPRRPPLWPYNLFCMIHGRARATVLAQVEEIRDTLALRARPHAVLFSQRRYKQTGARYAGLVAVE
jgi:DNA-binding Lrp family transcriptional regulator